MIMEFRKENTMLTKIKSPVLRFIYKYAMIEVGSIIYAIAISLLLDPNKLAPGGVTGIAIIVNHYTHFSTGTVVFIINIPLMIIGVWKFGMKFLVSTIVATVSGSVFIDLAAPYGPVSTEPFICSLLGGVLMGLSLGMIFKVGATTGGTDIVARLLKLRFPHIETGRLFIMIDTLIVLSSALAFHDFEIAAYAGISVFITGKVFDIVLYGGEGAKLLFVISDKEAEIAQRFMTELDSGVTYVHGIGAYTSSDKKIVMCALKKQLLPKAEDIIKEVDLNAFIIITSANEIVGEGYKSPLEDRI